MLSEVFPTIGLKAAEILSALGYNVITLRERVCCGAPAFNNGEFKTARSLAEKNDDLIIFGSYGTMSTGVNIKNLHHVIFASPSKSRVRVLQSIGRGLRKANQKDRCMLYDVADDFRKNGGRSNFTLSHLAERIKYYTEEDFEFTIQEVSLNSIVQLT